MIGCHRRDGKTLRHKDRRSATHMAGTGDQQNMLDITPPQ
jgi:hypothetical protein